MFLDYAALFLVAFVVIFIFYAIIVIHDIPYEIAKHRNHPHQDAIHVAGWVSLFTLHVLWPFLWIWSTLYREDRGWGFSESKTSGSEVAAGGASLIIKGLEMKVDKLSERLALLESKIRELEKIEPDLEEPEVEE